MLARLCALCALALGFAFPAAAAAPINVSLLLTENDSSIGLEVVRLLKADPATSDVNIRLYTRFDVPPDEGTQAAVAVRHARHLESSKAVFISHVLLAPIAKSASAQTALSRVVAAGGSVHLIDSDMDRDYPNLPLTKDAAVRAYMEAGGAENMANMVRVALTKWLTLNHVAPPNPVEPMGYFDPFTKRIHQDFAAYARECALCRPERPWVGILIYRGMALSGQTETIRALSEALAARGLNPVTVYGSGAETPAVLARLLMDEKGRPRIDALLALAGKFGLNPHTSVPFFQQLNAPVINLITLASQTRAEWEASPVGLDFLERAWQVGSSELGGLIAPTVVASKERRHDKTLGLDYAVEVPIPERVERAAERARRWIDLRDTPHDRKRVALLYYNYPPGKENIGASYLNVLPQSLWSIVQRLKAEGYNTGTTVTNEAALFDLIHTHGNNIGKWSPGALEALARGGHATLLPVSTYRAWFNRLPKSLREPMLTTWGDPEETTLMVWRDAKGVPHFVFPTVRLGNMLLAPQPDRSGDQYPNAHTHTNPSADHRHAHRHADPNAAAHDITVPPLHHYLAFYLWLQREFNTHAMVHVGTHGTHEWHSGKEVGFTEADPGEVFVGAVPQLYPYIVDDIGEALQAKRRGMATIISHLTPPLNQAGLNPELVKLKGLIADWTVAHGKSPTAADAILSDLSALAITMGIVKDVGLAGVKTEEDVHVLGHYLKEVEKTRVPFGLHTFGRAPAEQARLSTADAMLSLDSNLPAPEREALRADYVRRLEVSGQAELDALIRGLAGGYVAAGPGNDPMRNPDSLPTGRNLYGFDPMRMPSPGIYEAGAKLAEDLVSSYHTRHGQYPDKLTFTLWSVESMRHEGILEAQILRLLGVKPVWDQRGRVMGVEPISRQELGRPRVDVVMLPSGLYRDLNAVLMRLLDQAVTVARQSDEPDNPLAANYTRTRAALMAQGVPEAQAERLAGVRVFSTPTGTYGSQLNRVIRQSNTWQDEAQVADTYFTRKSYPFGQGLWGAHDMSSGVTAGADQPIAPMLRVDLFKMALQGAKASIISRSSNIYAALDNDDVYQELGGAAMAVRAANREAGNSDAPEVMVLNLSNPKDGKHETIDKFIGREMRSRYLNPEWIKAMLKEGYAGAGFVNKVAENLWGWQVTVPEAVDGAKWQELYETYVVDRHGLEITQKFREAKNLLAYQGMVDRMLTAVNKGYWKADAATVEGLQRANREVIAEAGVACDRDSCSSADITSLAEAQDRKIAEQAASQPAPKIGARQPTAALTEPPQAAGQPAGGQPTRSAGAPPAPTNAAQPQSAASTKSVTVEGFEMTEQTRALISQIVETAPVWLPLLFGSILALGWLARRSPR